MRRWTARAVAQVMACRLFSTKPLSEPIHAYKRGRLNLQEHTLWISTQNAKLSIPEDAFENFVCEMGAIMFRGD